MEICRVIIINNNIIALIILITVSLPVSSADTHSLQYIYTGVTPGINFPEFTEVGLVDGQEFVYYDSNIRKTIPKTEWIQKVTSDYPDYWNARTQISQGAQETYKDDMDTAMKRFNQTTGLHTLQVMVHCECDDDSTTRRSFQIGYDGEDFLSLDLKTKTWIAVKNESLMTKDKWDETGSEADYLKNYVETTCIEWLQKYLSYGKETLQRKVRPEASVFQKHSSSPEVVCHATGFFPRSVMITWQKDGEDVYEDVELRETLPNGDGSFQRRSILTVPAEELQKHTYTCVIQHSSLEKELVIKVPKDEGSDGRSDGLLIGIIIAVVVGLVALVAVVVGISVWKKKNSDVRPGRSRAPKQDSHLGLLDGVPPDQTVTE